jgi:hypothetical protein
LPGRTRTDPGTFYTAVVFFSHVNVPSYGTEFMIYCPIQVGALVEILP